MSVILRDVLITEVVERRSRRLMIAVVGVFAVMTAPLAVALPTTMVLRGGGRVPAFVVFVVWILQLLRTLAHPLLRCDVHAAVCWIVGSFSAPIEIVECIRFAFSET